MESVVGSKTSVFVGASARDYETLLLRDPENPAKYLGTGIGTSLLANRISWFFDLRGPSIALDTACSSSLSALHLACQSLRSHETKLVSLIDFFKVWMIQQPGNRDLSGSTAGSRWRCEPYPSA